MVMASCKLLLVAMALVAVMFAGSCEAQSPVIVVQPTSAATIAGDTVSFYAQASIGNVQWFSAAPGSNTFAPIAGATTNTYALPAAVTQAQSGTQFYAAFTNGAVTVNTVTVTLTVSTPPAITTNPSSVVVSDHQSVFLTVAFTGTPTPTVQWQQNNGKDDQWANIPGATTTSLDISSHLVDRLSNQGWQYRAVVTNSGGTVISSVASVTINTPPIILQQNRTINGLNNGFVSFYTTAVGMPPPSVQWSVSADRGVTYTPVTGVASATMPILTLRVFSSNTGYFYRATYSNAAGSATSDDILLLVPEYSPPTIFVQPQSQTIVLGTDVTFSVDWTGAEAPTFQWQIMQTMYPYWLNIPGATSASYTRVAVTDADRNAQFRVILTNRLGQAISNAALLTIPTLTPPAIITQPTFTGRTTWGTLVTLTTRASGSPVPTAQWQRTFGSNMVYTNIPGPGAQLPTYSFIAAPNDTLSSFRVVYTNSAGTVTSSAFTLTLATPTAPLFELNPVPLTVQTGDTAVFSVLVSGSPVPNIQWQVSADNGFTYTNITGQNGMRLLIVNASSPVDNQYKLFYRAFANNTNGLVYSTAAFLTVVRADAPVFTLQPATQEVPVGGRVVFESRTTAHPPATYQWQSSQDGINFVNVPGATFQTLEFSAVASSQQNTYYRVIATNLVGSTTSTPALLTVYSANAPVVTVQPKPKNVLYGSTVSLVSLAVGSPTPTVQWYSRSAATQNFTAIAGATANTYSFSATGFQQFRAVFTNTDGTATSAIATINVYGRLYRVSKSAASTLSVSAVAACVLAIALALLAL